jgi:hypothetical protein
LQGLAIRARCPKKDEGRSRYYRGNRIFHEPVFQVSQRQGGIGDVLPDVLGDILNDILDDILGRAVLGRPVGRS